MALFLLHRVREEDRRHNGLHSAIVQASDAAAARALAGVPPTWAAVALSGLATGTVSWLEGDAVSMLGMTRGGDRIA
jgi:hypothetical protein